MFVLFWVTLFSSVRGSNADTGSFPGGKKNCQTTSYCITLSEAVITAEAGLCVVIPCSFTTAYGFTPQHIVWFKCEQYKPKCGDSDVIFHTNKTEEVHSGFKGRVSLLEPDLRQKNCSIIVNDLTESDSGSYQLRVNGLLNGRSNGFLFSPRAAVSVKALIQKPTVMIPPLTEGQQTTLTCTAPGLCSGSDPKITWTWRGAGEKDSHITGNITAFKTESLTAVTQRHSSTLTFNTSAEHHGTNVTCKVSFTGNTTTEETVTLNVTYMKKPIITGDTTVEKGGALNLTCNVESFPPSHITWTLLGSDTNLHTGPDTDLQNVTGSATLALPNVTTEHSGQYVCTAKHLDTTVTVFADLTVTWFSKILKNSGCEVQSEVLTCVCISEGFPLPTIKWPLLKNHAEYSVITTVSNHTVNSTATLTVKDHSNTVVECVSSNENGEAKENLTIRINTSEKEGQSGKVLEIVSRLEVIIAFLIGVLLSAVLCCLAIKCYRKKQKSSGNLDETLEMVTSQEDPLIYAGQAVEDDQTYYQETAEEGGAVAAAAAAAAEKAAPDLDSGPKDVEYASIDFSVLKRKSLKKQETTETEYAEIKKQVREERENNGEEEGEVLEGKEEEAMIGEDEETNHCVPEEEEGDDVAVYSNVKDIMSENKD